MSGGEPSRKTERFSYYARLSKVAQRIYDASDAVGSVELSDAGPPRDAHRDLVEQLTREDRRGAARAAQRLAHAICDTCRVPRLLVKVLSRRPKDDSSELHGLYVREEAAVAVISVWMRTAERRQVVKPRTFVRTLLHELVHHLDYELLKLKDSFHTRGFYRREASLYRQLALAPADRGNLPQPPRARALSNQEPPRQLLLFESR